MANWLGLAGGAAEGVLAGLQDNRQREMYEFQKRQMARQEAQQKIEDAAEAQYRAVPEAGEFQQEVRTPEEQGMMGPSPNKVTKQFTPQQQRKAQIAALTKGTGAQRRDAATLQQQMNQQEEYEFQKHQRDVALTYLRANMLADDDPEGAVRLLGEKYDAINDGRKVVIQKDDKGVSQFGIADQSGKWIKGHEPKEITAAAAKKLASRALEYASEDLYKFTSKLDVDKQQAATAARVAATGERRAATEDAKSIWESTGPGGQAHIKYWGALGNAAGVRANKEKQTKADVVKEEIDALSMIYMEADPKMSKENARKMAAGIVLRDPNAKAAPDVGLQEQGLFRVAGKLYRMSPTGKPEEVLLPADLNKLAGSMAGVLGGPGSATTPNSAFRSSTMPSVTKPGAALPAAISPRDLAQWQRISTPGIFKGPPSYQRRNAVTGETISEDEFNLRTAE